MALRLLMASPLGISQSAGLTSPSQLACPHPQILFLHCLLSGSHPGPSLSSPPHSGSLARVTTPPACLLTLPGIFPLDFPHVIWDPCCKPLLRLSICWQICLASAGKSQGRAPTLAARESWGKKCSFHSHDAHRCSCCCSVTQGSPDFCDPMDCNTPGFPVHHKLPKLAQAHVY